MDFQQLYICFSLIVAITVSADKQSVSPSPPAYVFNNGNEIMKFCLKQPSAEGQLKLCKENWNLVTSELARFLQDSNEFSAIMSRMRESNSPEALAEVLLELVSSLIFRVSNSDMSPSPHYAPGQPGQIVLQASTEEYENPKSFDGI